MPQPDRAQQALESAHRLLNTRHGIKLSWPGFNGFDPAYGGVTTYPPGAKENGGIFLHTNPWAIMANAIVGNGDRAYEYYRQINPAAKNDRIDEFEVEPYVYPQNILGDEHPQFGLGRNSWLSGTSSWMYQAGTQYILGLRPTYTGLLIDPCIPHDWPGFTVTRQVRGATYVIEVQNPDRVCKGVKSIEVDGQAVTGNIVPYLNDGQTHHVVVIHGGLDMLELSIMNHGALFVEEVRALLRQFEQDTQIEVHLRVLEWRDAWAELVRAALYNDGPHISEIGNTWLSEFISMNALRPFIGMEVSRLGGAQQFLPSAWQSAMSRGPSGVTVMAWAVPWLADMRLIHYRQDVLEQAGIEPATAFQSAATLLQTCARLHAAGVINPIVLPSRQSRMTLQNMAGWVWGAGGDFTSPDGKKVLFASAEAKAGIYAYFDLARYMAAEMRDLDEYQSDAAFLHGQAALTISGPGCTARPICPAKWPRMPGRRVLPGVPYIGGSHLVIWKHTRYVEQALTLIRFYQQRGGPGAAGADLRPIPHAPGSVNARTIPQRSVLSDGGRKPEVRARFPHVFVVGVGGNQIDRSLHGHLVRHLIDARRRHPCHCRPPSE